VDAGGAVVGAVVVAPGVVVVICDRHGEALLNTAALFWSEMLANDVQAWSGNGIAAPLGSR
jgi:hypothetical protein